jgi:hypothetical protein
MSGNKNHSPRIPKGRAEIAKAGVDEHAGVSSSAPLTLVRANLPALDKKPQTHSASAKKVLYQEQYRVAIAMSSAELGAVIKEPTKRITEHVGHAIAYEAKAKMERDTAQAEFSENIAYYYEAKQRLLNPGYRTDVDGGTNRMPDENQKNCGAPDWKTFNENCNAYSLQHADRLLKQFAKCNNLLTDDGENIDDPDPEPEDVEPADSGRRNTKDVTAQKRYEHIATAAMEIASRNPEGEVEKLILAAAKYVPAPVMPLQPDIYIEVLSFITMIATLASNENVKGDAKKLLNKMLLYRPAPDPTKILGEATAEEKRKRDRRLAKKNGQALGSSVRNPSTSQTSEHVQRLELEPHASAAVIKAVCSSSSEPEPESAVTVPASKETKVCTSSMPVVANSLAAAVGSIDSSSTGRDSAPPAEVNAVLVQNLVDEDSKNARADSMEDTLRPPANMVWTQLVPGKKYETRPAPLGGHGVYEPRSTVILQWYADEDDARDAIDPVTAIAVGV